MPIAIQPMVVRFVPATPEGIRALTSHGVLFGLAFSDLLAIAAILMSTVTAILLYRSQTAREERYQRRADDAHRLDNAVDFHREFNSREFAEVRSSATAFVRANIAIDWENEDELERYDTAELHAHSSIYEIMRFYDRVEVFRSLGRLDMDAAARLLGKDLAWWEGLAFRRMGDRKRSRTLPNIRSLIAAFQAYYALHEWEAIVDGADAFARKSGDSGGAVPENMI
jgi:hypothetical protein